ncbi:MULTISPECIES: class I SAM-dependent methyltransferase [unclassified Streptomyces]|uniref:class I SAM-dependent methyltransferase n=1 Tax=unclassified Streptomyces TaxID=2593676 RepID=UPI0033A52D01
MTANRELHDLRRLILAAEGDAGPVLHELGVARAAGLVVGELVDRADLDEVPGAERTPVTVRFDLAFEGDVVAHHVVAGKTAGHHPGAPKAAHATVKVDLLELVRAVFGGWRSAGCQNLSIVWNDLEDVQALSSSMHVFDVVRRLVRGTTEQPADLADLSLRNGSDKWGLHYYTPHYERHFAPLRDRPLTIVELGIGGYGDPAAGGASLRMWKRYFPRALVHGVDVFDKSALREPRIHTIQGDLSDPEFLTSLGERIGPIDIVIDDGSHYCPDVITTFRTLFPLVRPGGLYVVEDLQTSYWAGYGGSSRRRDDPATSMGYLKRLVDGLTYEDQEEGGVAPDEVTRTLTGAHFYRSMAVFDKGVNAEGPSPSWIPRTLMSHEEMTRVDWGGDGLRATDEG